MKKKEDGKAKIDSEVNKIAKLDSDIKKHQEKYKILEKKGDQDIKALDDYKWFKSNTTRTRIVKIMKDGKGKQYHTKKKDLVRKAKNYPETKTHSYYRISFTVADEL